MGGGGGSLAAALQYSGIVFAGTPLVWLMNAVASAIRGTGNMLVPSAAVCVGVFLLIPLSPVLIFGIGPVPALGVAGAGAAVVLTTALTGGVLCRYLLSPRSMVRPRLARLRWAFFADILRVGVVGSVNTLQTTLTVALTTALVGIAAGSDAVAGYGTGSRLEYLLIPLVFGLGAPLVALVGTNIGAGQRQRALHAALLGGAVAFCLAEAIGIAAALWPAAWLSLFDTDPRMLETGAAYLRMVGPTYGFLGLGLCLYFASQGAGRLLWPLLAGLVRMLLAIGGGWLALRLTGSLAWLFLTLGVALVAYGSMLLAAIASGAWFREPEEPIRRAELRKIRGGAVSRRRRDLKLRIEPGACRTPAPPPPSSSAPWPRSSESEPAQRIVGRRDRGVTSRRSAVTVGELGLGLGGRLGLVASAPFVVGHPVDQLAGLVIGHRLAALLRGGAIPLGQAGPAEAGEVHQVDVLHIGAAAQVLDERAEGGGLELGLGLGVHRAGS